MPDQPEAATPQGDTPAAPPFGSSAATQPTANRGYEMAGLQRLGVIVRGLEQLIPLLGSASESGRDVLKALNMLSKHVPPGSVSPAAEANQIQQMAIRNAQQGQMAARLRQGLGGGGGAAAPTGGGGAGGSVPAAA